MCRMNCIQASGGHPEHRCVALWLAQRQRLILWCAVVQVNLCRNDLDTFWWTISSYYDKLKMDECVLMLPGHHFRHHRITPCWPPLWYRYCGQIQGLIPWGVTKLLRTLPHPCTRTRAAQVGPCSAGDDGSMDMTDGLMTRT